MDFLVIFVVPILEDIQNGLHSTLKILLRYQDLFREILDNS